MSGPLLLRRLWPQKVRTRLTLTYALLFLASGTILLGLAYGLVAATLPTRPSTAESLGVQQLTRLNPACQPAGLLPGGTPSLAPAPVKPTGTQPPSAVPASSFPGDCKEVYLEVYDNTAAGLQSVRSNTLDKLLVFSLLGLAVLTVASGGLGWFMSGRVVRPVQEITGAARRASEQHLGERLALSGPRDELKELADTFDDMLERLDAAFATQRRFVADASHELRTPLTVMRTAIDVTLAKQSPTEEQLAGMAVRVRDCVDRAEAMIEALLTLAVSDQGKLNTDHVDLATLAEDALDAATAEIRRLGLRADADLSPAETAGDPQLLERMIANLAGNAVRHNEPGGWIAVRTGTRNGTAYLEVSNSGPVVPENAIPSLFEPFRRMKARTGVHDGVGLGLAIARSVATAHGAILKAHSRPTGGLTVTVEIPVRDAETGPRYQSGGPGEFRPGLPQIPA